MENDNNNELSPASPVNYSHFPEDNGEVPAPSAGEFYKPFKLVPKTLLGFLFLLLSSANFMTKGIVEAIEDFKKPEGFVDFIEKIREGLVNSLKAGLTTIEARNDAPRLFTNLPKLRHLHEIIISQFLLYPDLREAVNGCLRTGNLGNGLIVYLIFLCKCFFDSKKALRVVRDQNLSSLRLYREITPEDKDETSLVEGYHWMCEKFTIWRVGEPTIDIRRHISLEISWENIKKGVILGVFVNNNQVLLAPYGNFIVEEKIIDDQNEIQRIKLRVCPQKRIKNCLEYSENEEKIIELPENFGVAPIQVIVEESSSKFLIKVEQP